VSLENDIGLIRQAPFFRDLPNDQLRLIAFSAVRRDVAAGGRLFRAGDRGASGFVVASGAIELTTGTGRDRRVLEVCEAGCLIGTTALLVETKRPCDATARGVSAVLEISRQLMQRMLEEHPELATRLERRLAKQVSGALGELERVRQKLLQIGSD